MKTRALAALGITAMICSLAFIPALRSEEEPVPEIQRYVDMNTGKTTCEGGCIGGMWGCCQPGPP